MSDDYKAESIESLDYFEHIRRYPGMYVGSKDINGLHHCVKELLSNSIDEYLNGAGTEIYIKFNKDGSIFIKDNGRGIPHGQHQSGCSILQACYGIANTGGKFNNATGTSGYNTSGGEHGTGCKAVNALSKKLIATTTREGIKEIVEFSQGKFVAYNKESAPENESGVSVLFYPDNKIFETVSFDASKLQKMIQEFSFLCSGLKFIFEIEDKEIKEFYSENGLQDYLKYLNGNNEMLIDPIYIKGDDGTFQVEAIVGYNNSYNSSYKLYTNNIPQEKGTHLTGFKTAWTSTLNTWAKENKILKEKDNNFSGTDLEEGQIVILNFKMIDPVFKGQNKEELSSSEGRIYVQRIVSNELKNYIITHEKDIKTILNKAINARKAREASKKARDAIREATSSKDKKKRILDLPTKLVDANSKNRLDCELLICEGDSAASGLIAGRNSENQAVFPIRGKIINVFKSSIDKSIANVEVNGIIKAIGLDIGANGKLIYDKNKLRYGKILMATDGDPDGRAIKNLLLTLFWWLCPELVINGHIYSTEPPLFRITTKKNEYIFLKDLPALEDYKSKHQGESFLINRNKGLGEQDTAELSECLLNPETRNIVQIKVNDVNEADRLLDMLMGTSVPPRRQWLLEHSEEARGEFDI